MAKTLSASWILPTVEKALQPDATLESIHQGRSRRRIVQVVDGDENAGYVVVNDFKTKIAVFFTKEAIQAHRANQGKTLGQLRGSLISLDQWIISTPMACSNPKTAPSWNRFARTISDSLNPICLQSSAFTSLGADGCAIFGDPCFLNDHPQVWVAIQGGGYNSYSLLIKQLAVAQGYKGLLPDCEGVDMAGSHGVGADADCPARVTEEEYELMRAAWDNPSPQPLQQGGGEAASSAVASPAKAVMPWADMDAENSGSEGGQDYETQQGMESMPIFASQADVRMEVMTSNSQDDHLPANEEPASQARMGLRSRGNNKANSASSSPARQRSPEKKATGPLQQEDDISHEEGGAGRVTRQAAAAAQAATALAVSSPGKKAAKRKAGEELATQEVGEEEEEEEEEEVFDDGMAPMGDLLGVQTQALVASQEEEEITQTQLEWTQTQLEQDEEEDDEAVDGGGRGRKKVAKTMASVGGPGSSGPTRRAPPRGQGGGQEKGGEKKEEGGKEGGGGGGDDGKKGEQQQHQEEEVVEEDDLARIYSYFPSWTKPRGSPAKYPGSPVKWKHPRKAIIMFRQQQQPPAGGKSARTRTKSSTILEMMVRQYRN